MGKHGLETGLDRHEHALNHPVHSRRIKLIDDDPQKEPVRRLSQLAVLGNVGKVEDGNTTRSRLEAKFLDPLGARTTSRIGRRHGPLPHGNKNILVNFSRQGPRLLVADVPYQLYHHLLTRNKVDLGSIRLLRDDEQRRLAARLPGTSLFRCTCHEPQREYQHYTTREQ